MKHILYPSPINLFQGMWETGIYLNCNVYWTCTTGCRYCYVALNRRDLRHEGTCDDPFAGIGKFALLLNKVFSDRKYAPERPLEYFLRNRYPMMLSNNSDPLSTLEVQYGYTRQYLEVLADINYPLQILSKFNGWAALDQDAYIALLKRFSNLWVSVTLTADNDTCLSHWEPGGPTVGERLAIVKQLADAGVPVEVHCTPFIPSDSFQGGQWDDPETYRPWLQRVASAGAFGVTIAPLCFDAPDARVITQAEREYIQQHDWCNSPTDRPWRCFLPDVDYMGIVSRIFYQEAQALGLQCGLHPAFVSVCGDGTELDNSCCCPSWVDRSASWIAVANRLRDLQAQHAAPIVAPTAALAERQVRECQFKDHEFAWKDWRGNIPHRFRDTAYMARVKSMPDTVTAYDVVKFQLDEMCRWSDSLWTDIATAPVSLSPGTQTVDEGGDLLLSYDGYNIRDSWAACRHRQGWDGRTRDELSNAVAADGLPIFE